MPDVPLEGESLGTSCPSQGDDAVRVVPYNLTHVTAQSAKRLATAG